MIELAIVIIIMGLLMAGSFEASKYFLLQNRIKATNLKLNTIQNALDIYLIEHGKLPCPAGLKTNNGESTSCSSISSTNTTTGLYYYDGIISGGVPYVDLGLTPDLGHDAWNAKIIYRVSHEATDSKIKYLTSYEAVDVYNNSVSANNLITDEAIYSLISNGANKAGAINADTNNQISSKGLISNNENYNQSSTNTRTTIYFSDKSYGDDIIRYKTRMQLLYDTKIEDIRCEINNSILSDLLSDITTNVPSFPLPTDEYMDYNEEIESSNSNSYKLKCFKYGRIGVFKYED